MRVQIIECLVDLISEDEVTVNEVEECLDEFMETNFNTLCDEHSHVEMAHSIIRVRAELTFCAKEDLDLETGSSTLNVLREFNKKNIGVVDQMSEFMQQKRKEMDEKGGSDSDGFESLAGDSQCESFHSGDELDEEDVQMQETTKQIDDDGFEEVQDKKQRRR